MSQKNSKKLWEPSFSRLRKSHMSLFQDFVTKRTQKEFRTWEEFHSWSTDELGLFWKLLSEYLKIQWQKVSEQTYRPPRNGKIQGARWFEGSCLNYAENLLKGLHPEGEVLLEYEESRKKGARSAAELWDRVAILASYLKKIGLKKGDVVVGVLSNCIESVEAMLAVTSLGGVWSSCSPDFGAAAIEARLQACQAKLIFYSESYSYKGKSFECAPRLEVIFSSLSSLERVIHVGEAKSKKNFSQREKISYEALFDSHELEIDPNTGVFPINFKTLEFSDPLYIMFSSGTTGPPKCIVHGVGGTLLQHKKELMLHCDLKAGEGFSFYTNTSWMMWNWMVSSLSVGARLLLYQGAPSYPEPLTLWEVAEKESLSTLGTSPAYLSYSKKFFPKDVSKRPSLPKLKTLLSTGSPLLPEHFRWVYSTLKKDIHLASISGGTDILSCFVLGNPNLPVYEGEIQVAGLGMAIETRGPKGARPGEKAELVCKKPFVSMPLYFLNDPGGKKLTKSYFSFYPSSKDEVWRHGDYIEQTETGGYIIHGRSDATLNPNGVRMGTGEFYNILESIPGVEDSLVVAHKAHGGDKIILFVALGKNLELTENLKEKIVHEIETKLSKRHRPYKIFQVKEIPYTSSGKKLEILVTHLINGEKLKNLSAVKNPEALEGFKGPGRILQEGA